MKSIESYYDQVTNKLISYSIIPNIKYDDLRKKQPEVTLIK
ncbi:MAG: hypothetical protein K0R06_3305 [Clostridium sp.]|jgi:hypothetical protein|nr:hypothetical protein [Clostridium sp.]